MQNVKEAKSVNRLLSEAATARRKGDTDKAGSLYRQVLARFPGNPKARKGLANLVTPSPDAGITAVVDLLKQRRFADALAAATDILESDPENVLVQRIQAECHSMTGRPDVALEIYWRLLDGKRDDADMWRGAGSALYEMMRMDQAIDCLKIATQLAPENIDNWLPLSRAYLQCGNYVMAYNTLSQVLGRNPDHTQALVDLARVIQNFGKTELAIATLERAIDCATASDDRANAYVGLASLRSSQGDKKEACALYDRALEDQPDKISALSNLARIADPSRQEEMRARLESKLANKDLTGADRAHLHFSLFSIMDRANDDPSEAFEHLQKGNALRRESLRQGTDGSEIVFEYLKSLTAASPAYGKIAPGVRPIFIVGMPRSGTSVTEQMISAAPGVRAGGEMAVAENLGRELARCAFLANCKALGEEDLRILAEGVRDRMTPLSHDAPVLIDKMPLNFRWAGLLLLAMPDARVVHTRRDPIETCWSNYKASYASLGNRFAYDQSDLASFYLKHDDLCRHWQQLFPDRFRTFHYEDLVASPEPTMRDMIEFCDLEWTDDCLHPEKAGRAVLTASAHQVRKPIYNGNTGDWRRYEALLGPMINGLAAADAL